MNTKRRKPIDLTCGELLAIVENVRDILYLDLDYRGDFYSGSKVWSNHEIEFVATALDVYDLRPADNKRSGS